MIAGCFRELTQTFSLGTENQSQRRTQRDIGKIGVATAVQSDKHEAVLSQLFHAAREILDCNSGTSSSAPDADFANTPVASGLWRAVVMMALTAKAAAERKMAPTLCGSVIWSRTSTMPSDASSEIDGAGRGSASARRP